MKQVLFIVCILFFVGCTTQQVTQSNNLAYVIGCQVLKDSLVCENLQIIPEVPADTLDTTETTVKPEEKKKKGLISLIILYIFELFSFK